MKVDVIIGFLNDESCPVVFSRKDAASSEPVDPGRRVSPGNVHAFACALFIIPRYSYAMGCVLTADTKRIRYVLRTNVFEPNQAHSSNSVSALKFGTKWRGQLTLNHQRIHSKIHQEPATDQASDIW
jgi:hypothetical protein